MRAGTRRAGEIGVSVLIDGDSVRGLEGVGAVSSAAATQVGGVDDCRTAAIQAEQECICPTCQFRLKSGCGNWKQLAIGSASYKCFVGIVNRDSEWTGPEATDWIPVGATKTS